MLNDASIGEIQEENVVLLSSIVMLSQKKVDHGISSLDVKFKWEGVH